jgi:multidrug efflux system outer membrane protein
MKKFQALISAIWASSLIGGCMVGPNYHKPVVEPPTTFRDLRESPQAEAQVASYADLPWWQVFQDPQLQDLIRTAL